MVLHKLTLCKGQQLTSIGAQSVGMTGFASQRRLFIPLELQRYADQLLLYPQNNVPSAAQLPEDDLRFFREKIDPVPVVGHPPPHYAPQHYASSPPTTGANSSRDPPPSSYHPAQPSSSSSQIRRTLPSPGVQHHRSSSPSTCPKPLLFIYFRWV
ncbi:hypothetical protein FRC03_006190 [Tulasnella sp. 419]|nr:hypothetical protein FRC03_006190 [Tulasnella sp. 419]